MDIERIKAAMLHSSITVQQALELPLITPEDMRPVCKRPGCGNRIDNSWGREYCTDKDCQYLVQLERSRLKRARRKQRRGAA